jgi:translation initiation factor IF-1
VKLPAEIVQCLDDRTIRVRLPNGHVMTGIVPKKLLATGFKACVGAVVFVLVTPFDMSKGMVTLEN